MIFNSRVHGKIKYEEQDVLIFNRGILGFNYLKKFLLVDLKGLEPFKLFQSLEDENIGMIVISPFDFFKDYEIKLNDDTINNLNINCPEEVKIINTVTLNSDPKEITTNLQGPLIINISNNLGEQIIVDDSKYKVKELLTKE